MNSSRLGLQHLPELFLVIYIQMLSLLNYRVVLFISSITDLSQFTFGSVLQEWFPECFWNRKYILKFLRSAGNKGNPPHFFFFLIYGIIPSLLTQY